MNDRPDPRPPASGRGSPDGFDFDRALLGWFLLGVGALSVYLLFMPLFGEMVRWKVAWAAAIVLTAGIAFRAGHWFQKRDMRRRAGRKTHRNRAPWSVHRCLAMIFTGASLFAIGWAQVLFPTFHDFILGMIIGWTSLVGSGGGMLFVGCWELHRRVHAQDLAAAAERQRLFAHWGVVLWGATCAAALGCFLLWGLLLLEHARGATAVGLAAMLVIAAVVGGVFVGAARRLGAALRASRRPNPRQRLPSRPPPERPKRRRRRPDGVLRWIGEERDP